MTVKKKGRVSKTTRRKRIQESRGLCFDCREPAVKAGRCERHREMFNARRRKRRLDPSLNGLASAASIGG